jgi:hypothetical protein
MPDNQADIRSGSGSINIGQHNTIADAQLHIGDVHHHHQGGQHEPIAYIHRSKVARLSIFGASIKAGWVVTIAVLGLIGSIASAASDWPTSITVWHCLLGAGLIFLLSVGVALRRHGFCRHPLIPGNLEADASGRVFLTKVEGTCPKCGGTLRLRELGTPDQRTTVVRCNRNPGHEWDFDFTVLGEPQEL